MQYFRSKEIAMEDEGANQSAPPMMGFGLFDGHGFSSGVADLCEESLLLDIGKELEILRAVNPNSGDEPSLTEDDCIREAFRKLQAQADARFSGERVGSTATVVLATPSVSHEEVRHLRTPIRSRRRLSSDLERTPEKAQLSRNATSLGAAQSPGVIASPSSFEGVSKSLFLGSDLSASAGAPSLDDSSSSTSPRSITAVIDKPNAAESHWKLTCAWCGDSRAIAVHGDGTTVQELSVDHRLEDPRERERVTDIFNRETAAAEDVPAGQRKTVVARRRCMETGHIGPEVIFNETTGVSLMVTRALGDSLGASAVIAEPEIVSVVVPKGSRIIIASDGVWDVFDNETVASLIRRIRDPRRAAVNLASRAKQRRVYAGLSRDDITVIIVEI